MKTQFVRSLGYQQECAIKIMKKLSFLYLFMIGILGFSQNNATAEEVGKVFLIPFHIELYVPANEYSIEERAMEKWWVLKSELLSCVQNKWFNGNFPRY